jgi:(p)ppGpp synthase/HD superfamily hydrolase
MRYSPRFEQGLAYAARLHASQQKKGKEIPYIAHLLGVASIAMEYGADEDAAIGALLHDAVEDQGGLPRLEEIERLFGGQVAAIVLACSDTWEVPKPPWRARKEQYLVHLGTMPEYIQLVSCADKLYNARCVLEDYRQVGDEVWKRFKGGKDGTLWYFRALVGVFTAGARNPALVAEFDRVVSALEEVTGWQQPDGGSS